MNPLQKLMVETVACFEEILAMLCSEAFDVNAFPSPGAIGVIATVTDADEMTMRARQDDVALERLADSIGTQSGIAQVSFQFE